MTPPIPAPATSEKRCTRSGITTTASITPRKILTKGLAGAYILFNEFDTGNENTGFRLPSFGDGRPVQVNSSRFSVAERVDVIVDFTNDAGKTFYLENRLEQDDGRGPGSAR